MKQENNQNLKSGFTVVETLMAITILLISIVGPLEIASKGLFSAFYARDEITAFYLAQEGVEYIRNHRDSLFLSDDNQNTGNDNWLLGLEDCIGEDTFCYIDVTKNSIDDDTAIENCPDGVCPVLKYDESSGIYSYDSFPASKYTREIRITPLGEKNYEALISVTVKWTSNSFGGSERAITIFDNLMNWQRR